VRVNTEKQSIRLVEKGVFDSMRYPMTPTGGRSGMPMTSEANLRMTIPKVLVALLLGLKNTADLSGSSGIVFTLTEDSDSKLVSVYFGVLGSTVLLGVENDEYYLCCLESYQDTETGEISLQNINKIWTNVNCCTLLPQFLDSEGNYTTPLD
jgi:hypothetical protein